MVVFVIVVSFPYNAQTVEFLDEPKDILTWFNNLVISLELGVGDCFI